MRLLIVEGNTEETRMHRESFGIRSYHIIFKEMISFMYPTARVDVVFPAYKDMQLPNILKLKKYDGILWTGSALSVLEDSLPVNQQLEFAEDIFKSGTPFYGSCWGLQIATVVSGGKVSKGKKGLEFGITQPIQLSNKGKESPFFKNRTNNFQALCIHYDEVEEIPEKTEVLASNSHSKVQAMTINYKRSQFFGVQYHPEFKTEDMVTIASFLKKNLVKNQYFSSITEAESFIQYLSDKKKLPIEVANYKLHSQEIHSWLNHLKND